MKRLSYSKLILLGVAAAAAAACTGRFEEYNTNKWQVTEEEMAWDNQKTGSFFAQMERGVTLIKDGTNEYSDYQVEQGLTADLYSGYVGATIAYQNGTHTGAYYFVPNWYDQTFTKRFTQVMAPFGQLKKVAEEQNLPEVAALATIVKIMAMHRAADAYGSIPYLSYGNGSGLSSNYDKLEDIYSSFFQELDESIDLLTVLAGSGATLMGNYDYVYGGDLTKWVKMANTLRLRLALRVAYANPVLAKQEAEKSVNNAIGLIEDKADRAVLDEVHTKLNYYHPLYEIAYNFNGGDCRPGASIIAFMAGYNDPRIGKYFTRTGAGTYVGVRNGVYTSTWDNYRGDKFSNFNITTASAVTWFTAAESYFLRAEGALRGWNMGGDAKTFYERGVTVSFEENGASGADAYLANATAVPGSYTDPVASNNCSNTSNVTVKYDETADFETNLERIITQKWIAIYPDGPEGWSEFRRTGYPKLFPVVNNASNGTVDTDIQVRRIPFPVSEYNNDAAGVRTGIAALGGADNGGTKVWWDKK